MSTPLEIDIALHYWTTATDYGETYSNFNAPAVVEQRQQMVDAGLLQECGPTSQYNRRYEPGPALEYFVNALCAVPWPIQKWVMPAISQEK